MISDGPVFLQLTKMFKIHGVCPWVNLIFDTIMMFRDLTIAVNSEFLRWHLKSSTMV